MYTPKVSLFGGGNTKANIGGATNIETATILAISYKEILLANKTDETATGKFEGIITNFIT